MPRIEIYTKDFCPYCYRATMLLRRHGAAFVEYSVSERPELFDAMVERAQGRSTVPQIFIDGVPIGGSDELALLDRCGQLEAMLGTGGNLSA